MKIFCYSCGKGNVYFGNKPEKCSFCSHSFVMKKDEASSVNTNEENFSFEDLNLNKLSFLEVISIDDDGKNY